VVNNAGVSRVLARRVAFLSRITAFFAIFAGTASAGTLIGSDTDALSGGLIGSNAYALNCLRSDLYAEVLLTHEVQAPANEVWAIVGDWSLAKLAAGALDRVDVNGAGVGAQRTLHLPKTMGGGSVTERQIARDDTLRTYIYSLEDFGSLPWAEYVGEWSVRAAGSRSVVVFKARILPLRGTKQDAIQISTANQERVFRILDRLFAQ
jgi:hypothetical protein